MRIGAIFIATCMVAIAASLGAVLYFGFRLDMTASAALALAALAVLSLYNGTGARLYDRARLGDRIADLSHGTADLARQVADVSRRLNAIETRVGAEPARGSADPLTAELGELSGLVQQLANTVAAHEVVLQQAAALARPTPVAASVSEAPLALNERDAISAIGRFSDMSRAEVADLVGRAIEADRLDLYFQSVVTLPQRKVRYYEALSRLRLDDGEIVAAGEFLDYAVGAGLMPEIDNLLLFRCVQVTRRLQMKNRDIGLFCNISIATLSDPDGVSQMLEFMQANRALADALTFEFTQSDYYNFGPIERECLAALAECGFRFSLDHVSDLRMEPKHLAENGFRFLKVPANVLLGGATDAQSDIHPEDFTDLLARSGISLIADRIENESAVLDLLDRDVRFGQGFLFSLPRPVRAEFLQGASADSGVRPVQLTVAAAS